MNDVTWEQCKTITEGMMSQLQPLTEENLSVLDGENGVYIITYTGNDLGLGGFQVNNEPKIVYVGLSKFNSSRHFKSGTTGTSTLRRSLGALFASKMDLTPIPRSNDLNDNDRFLNYAFDIAGEEKLTGWMKENFQFAFFVTDNLAKEQLNKGMIAYNCPLFNFQNNPDNKYGAEIKLMRKKCALAAKAVTLQ